MRKKEPTCAAATIVIDNPPRPQAQHTAPQLREATPIPLTLNITQKAIWIAHACSGSGVGELAIQHALQKLWTNNIQLAYIGGLSYEIDDEALRLHSIITHKCPIKLTPRGNIKQWPKDTHMAPSDPNVLKLLVAGTPCEKISRGALHTQHKKEDWPPRGAI